MHGLIAAPYDQSQCTWGCPDFLINGLANSVGSGQSNTNLIINACGATNIAARICNDLILNGYEDWYLPSKDELCTLRNQKDIIGGFSDDMYWSSSQRGESGDDCDAYCNPFFTSMYECNWSTCKSSLLRLRAIRSF